MLNIKLLRRSQNYWIYRVLALLFANTTDSKTMAMLDQFFVSTSFFLRKFSNCFLLTEEIFKTTLSNLQLKILELFCDSARLNFSQLKLHFGRVFLARGWVTLWNICLRDTSTQIDPFAAILYNAICIVQEYSLPLWNDQKIWIKWVFLLVCQQDSWHFWLNLICWKLAVVNAI